MKKISINNHWNSQLLQRILKCFTEQRMQRMKIIAYFPARCEFRLSEFIRQVAHLCYVMLLLLRGYVCVLHMCVCVSCACSTPRLASKFQSKAQTKKNEQQQRQAHFPSGQHESEIPFITLCTWCCCLLLLVLLLSSCFKWNCLSSWNFLRIM